MRTLAPERIVAPSGPALVHVRTGMGVAAARRSVERLPRIAVEGALLGGFTGALAPDLAPGTVVVADAVLDVASGALHALPLADGLAAAVRSAGLPLARGTLATIDHMVLTREAKRALRERSGAIAVDMESAALAAGLAARGVPAGVARVVSDAEHELVPALATFREHGVLRVLADGVRIGLRLRSCTRISARLLEAWLQQARREPA